MNERSRRWWIARMAALSSLGGCAIVGPSGRGEPGWTSIGGPMEETGPIRVGPLPESLYIAWNDPRMEEMWRTRPQPLHGVGPYSGGIGAEDRGISLSPNGDFVAIPLPRTPVNEVHVFDLKTGSARVYVHPIQRIRMVYPAISPNGENMAVVVSPPPYDGHCEIWIIELATGKARVLKNDRPRSVYWPTWSPDGRRIAYQRDVEAPPLPERRAPRPENISSVNCSLFDQDLTEQVETQVTPTAFFGKYSEATYANDANSFIVNITVPLVGVPREQDGMPLWGLPSGFIERDPAYLWTVVQRGQPIRPIYAAPGAPGYSFLTHSPAGVTLAKAYESAIFWNGSGIVQEFDPRIVFPIPGAARPGGHLASPNIAALSADGQTAMLAWNSFGDQIQAFRRLVRGRSTLEEVNLSDQSMPARRIVVQAQVPTDFAVG
jgi:hypothetical protein